VYDLFTLLGNTPLRNWVKLYYFDTSYARGISGELVFLVPIKCNIVWCSMSR